jgi:crotonobetainyl-CoA:carnitine CoA-transferase CaiB-like acyl-CoA transferase
VIQPLAGVRIVDLSWMIAGPLALRVLADFGAEVIRIESSHRMDPARGNRVPLYGELPGDANTNPDTGGYFHHDVNASKLSCTLDLALPEGRDRRLIAISDAVPCNLGGDQLERWGIGSEQARAIKPELIVINMPAMESNGPRARWRAFSDMFAGVAGLNSISGHPGDPPPRTLAPSRPASHDGGAPEVLAGAGGTGLECGSEVPVLTSTQA